MIVLNFENQSKKKKKKKKKTLDEAFDVAHGIETFHQKYSTQHIVENQWEEVKHFKLKGAAKMGMGGQDSKKEPEQQQKKKKKKGKKNS